MTDVNTYPLPMKDQKEHFRGGSGNTKKFLYREKPAEHTADDKQWSLGSKSTNNSAQALNLDNVWSIRKNVGIGKQKSDGLSYNANKNFYSRHSGIKERDSGNKSNEDSGKSWSQGRHNYSYTNSNQSSPPGSGGTKQSNNTGNTYGRQSSGNWSSSQHNF